MITKPLASVGGKFLAMKYDLSKQIDKERFKRRCNELYEGGVFVELVNIEKRSLRQNSYLHLILVYFACETGYELEYTKQHIFKVEVNKETFVIDKVNVKNGDIYQALRSTSDLNKDEMNLVIDRFLNYSAKTCKIRLPEPNDLIWLREIELLEQQNKQFL